MEQIPGADSFEKFLCAQAKGDCFKKMRKYKQALQKFIEAQSFLKEVTLDSRLLQAIRYKVAMKIGMTHYYLGNMAEAEKLLIEICAFYKQFD